MRITFLNQKGGVGKSTASILIGGVLAAAGYRVAFDDRDNQGSLAFWARQVAKLPLVGDGEGWDVVICDTPGRLELEHEAAREFLRPIVEESDRLVVVLEKSLFSTHATVPMIEFIKAARRPDARAALLFNKVRAATTIGRQDEDELGADLGLPVLKHSLPLAAPFENMQMEGMGAITGKHRELALTLALEILKSS